MQDCRVPWKKSLNTAQLTFFLKLATFVKTLKFVQNIVRNSAVAWNWSFGFLTKKANFEQKRQLHRVFWSKFRATGQLRTVFHTSFTFRTIRANLKQNDGCAEWSEANFEQQHGCARCFLEVLSKKANRISWILLTTHTNLGKLTVGNPLTHKL